MVNTNPPTDLQGRRFGRLVALDLIRAKRPCGDTYIKWRCRCDCGKIVVVDAASLCRRKRATFSCGCFMHETNRVSRLKNGHGHTAGYFSNRRSPTYSSWRAMMTRCSNKNQKTWSNYGGRGIRVCKRWRKFENFLTDMGERPPDKTIDRINKNGNYTPSNCKWSTRSEQMFNRRGWAK